MSRPAPTVHRLSGLLGRPVHADGVVIGTVVDLTIDLEEGAARRGAHEHPPLASLLIGRRRTVIRTARWADVVSLGPDGVTLRTGAPAPAEGANDRELRLGRDVLDAQVFVFEGGGRMARVSDLIVGGGDGEARDLRALAVDIGFGAVCHRLGLHRLAHRLGDEVIDWDQLHLASRSGHRIALVASRSAVHRVDATALAQLVSAMASDQGAEVLEAVDPTLAAAAVAALPPPVAERVVRGLTSGGAERVLGGLPHEQRHHLRRARSQAVPPRRRYLRHRTWRRRRRRSAPIAPASPPPFPSGPAEP